MYVVYMGSHFLKSCYRMLYKKYDNIKLEQVQKTVLTLNILLFTGACWKYRWALRYAQKPEVTHAGYR